ncbi:MAG: hypothetical protein NTV49_06640, partial [Kiritimatiellaeota bacterium]|nr:hypothetical protein [Kiritimatiellota bacterium]
EGLELHPEKSTLTKTDLEKIENIISESQPFFTQKIIHRIAGTTGRGQVARCLCTFLRGNKSTGTASHRAGLEYMRDQSSSGWRRTFKLVWLKDVGPVSQVVQTRDPYPVWTAPARGGAFRPVRKISRRRGQLAQGLVERPQAGALPGGFHAWQASRSVARLHMGLTSVRGFEMLRPCHGLYRIQFAGPNVVPSKWLKRRPRPSSRSASCRLPDARR